PAWAGALHPSIVCLGQHPDHPHDDGAADDPKARCGILRPEKVTGVRRKIDEGEDVLKLGPLVGILASAFAEHLIDEPPDVLHLPSAWPVKPEVAKVEQVARKAAGDR